MVSLRRCGLALLATCASSEHAHAQLHHGHQQPLNSHPSNPAPKRVAVIGAGAGGSSASYHLGQYAATAGVDVDISIFESRGYIGGRSTTVDVWDDPAEPVELGGSIFVKVNRILVEAVERFELGTSMLDSVKTKDADPGGPELGIWDGEQFVFTQQGRWWDLPKLFWRYGTAPIRTQRLMKDVVGRFLRMYDAPVFPWRDLSEVAETVGLTEVTGLTGEQLLAEQGIGEGFAREIVQASTRVNYAQNLPLIHGLETMVCMAASGAMSVDGGNWQIFAAMANSSAAHIHLNTSVTHVARNADGTFDLTHKSSLEDTSSTSTFDTIILAAPFHSTGLTFTPALSKVPDAVPYVHLHVTLFASPHALSPSAFSLPAGSRVPQTILTTLRPDENPGADPHFRGPGFFSISTLRRARNPHGQWEYVYKIFSAERASDSRITKLLGLGGEHADSETDTDDENSSSFPFSADADGSNDGATKGVSWIRRHLWHSYPYEYPRVTFDPVVLDENVWYTSGIESFISTMETSALSGRNVAALVVEGWEKGEVRGEGERELKEKL